MSAPLSLYLHVRRGTLVVSDRVGSSANLPSFFRQDKIPLYLHFVDDNPAGGITTPLTLLATSGLTPRVAIGSPGSPLATQLTFTENSGAKRFEGLLDLNTTELEAVFTAAGTSDLRKTFEVELLDGTARYTWQMPVTLKQDILRTGAPDPETYDPPDVLADNLALLLADTDDIDVVRTGDIFTFILKAAGRPTHWTAATQVAMLALAARKGDSCERTDTGRCWLLTTADPTHLANWYEIPAGIEWEGPWSAATTYAVNAGVSKSGSSYVSLQSSNLNHDPADPATLGVWWDVFALGSTAQPSADPDAESEILELDPMELTSNAHFSRVGHKHKVRVAAQDRSGLHSAADKRRFDHSVGPYVGGFDAEPEVCYLLGDSLFVAGAFTRYANTPAPKIAKLNLHGLPDHQWQPLAGFDTVPSFIRLASDGDFILGHNTKISYRGAAAAWLHKLDAEGTPDPAFTSPATIAAAGSDQLLDIACTPGHIWAVTWHSVRVMDLTGTTTATATSTNDNCHHLATQPGTSLVVLATRATTNFNGFTVPGALRLLEEDLDRDPAWVSGAGDGGDTGANHVIWSPTGEFLIAGNGGSAGIGTYAWDGGAANTHKGLYKLLADGTEDPDWTATIVMVDGNSIPIPFFIDSRNRVYFGGNVSTIDGTTVTPWRLYRLHADGSFDREFAQFNADVNWAAARDDDHLAVVGAFTAYGDVPLGRLAFLDAGGNLIPSLDEKVTAVQTVAISAAGTTRLQYVAGGLQSLVVTVTDSYGGGSFEHVLILPEFGATEGDRLHARCLLPASTDPTLTVPSPTVDDTPLLSVQSVSFATELCATFVYRNGAWELEQYDWRTPDGARVENLFTRGTVTYAATLNIDLDGPSAQEITLTGNITLGTLAASRAAAGHEKGVSLKLTASGADRTVAFASGVVAYGTAPFTLPSGKTARIALVSTGANETSTEAAWVVQP